MKKIGPLYIGIAAILILQFLTFCYIIYQTNNTDSRLTGFLVSMENFNKTTTELKGQFNNLNDSLENINNTQIQILNDLKLLKLSQDFVSIVESKLDAVVSIKTDKSLGAGFIISKDGYIITNWHVIEDAKFVEVKTRDKKIHEAKIIDSEKFRDIALLKIKGNFTYFQLENSNNLVLGQRVIAIGNPLGLSLSITQGVISGLDRPGLDNLEAYIQTDAAINPGNSGGPLIDTKGYVIGLNTYGTSDYENIGLALESNEIKKAVNELAGFSLIA